jgi:hypothetical protein
MVDKMKLIPYSKQRVKAACNACSTNFQADDLAPWIEIGEDTPVVQHLSEEDITAFVKNENTTDELAASDIGSDSGDNGDGFCEAVEPKSSKVLENINEVMRWLEQ